MSKFKVGDKVICSVDHTNGCDDFVQEDRAFIGCEMTIMSDEGLAEHPDDSYYVEENGSYWREEWLELVDPRYCPKPQTTPMPEKDKINPPHYKKHPSGVECINITEHFSFLRGNAIKYLWRAGMKDDVVQDLEKAKWYIDREIANINKEKKL